MNKLVTVVEFVKEPKYSKDTLSWKKGDIGYVEGYINNSVGVPKIIVVSMRTHKHVLVNFDGTLEVKTIAHDLEYPITKGD